MEKVEIKKERIGEKKNKVEKKKKKFVVGLETHGLFNSGWVGLWVG